MHNLVLPVCDTRPGCEMQGFSLRQLQHLVLDEADRILSLDFEEELDQILQVAKHLQICVITKHANSYSHVQVIPRERCTQLFSATMTSKVQKLQRACLRDPVKIEVATKYQTVATLRQQARESMLICACVSLTCSQCATLKYLFVPAKHKDCYLIHVLMELSGCTTMIFTRTCEATRRLTLVLRVLGLDAVPIHGNMSQPKRLGCVVPQLRCTPMNFVLAQLTNCASQCAEQV